MIFQYSEPSRPNLWYDVFWYIIPEPFVFKKTSHSACIDFWATVSKNGSPFAMVPLYMQSCLSGCDVAVLWLNGPWIKMPLGKEVCLSPGRIVLDGDQLPLQKWGKAAPPPQLSFHVYCGHMVVHLSNC